MSVGVSAVGRPGIHSGELPILAGVTIAGASRDSHPSQSINPVTPPGPPHRPRLPGLPLVTQPAPPHAIGPVRATVER